MAECADMEYAFESEVEVSQIIPSSKLEVIPELPEIDNIVQKIFSDEFTNYIRGPQPSGLAQAQAEDRDIYKQNTPEAVEAYKR